MIRLAQHGKVSLDRSFVSLRTDDLSAFGSSRVALVPSCYRFGVAVQGRLSLM